MTIEAVDWLPPAGPGESERAIARVVEDWLARWLVSPLPLAVAALPQTSGASGQVAEHEESDVALGLAVCAGRGDAGNLRDQALLAQIGRDMRCDLDAFLGLDSRTDVSNQKQRHFQIAPEQRDWTIILALGDHDIIDIRRQAAGASREIVLGPLGKALASERALIGCHLGTASLTAAEAAGIAIGDLVVLDGLLSQAMPVTIEGNLCSRGAARVTQLEGEIGIRLTEPINLEARTGDSNG